MLQDLRKAKKTEPGNKEDGAPPIYSSQPDRKLMKRPSACMPPGRAPIHLLCFKSAAACAEDDGSPKAAKGLSAGWTTERRRRTSESMEGHVDKYWISPAGAVCKKLQESPGGAGILLDD